MRGGEGVGNHPDNPEEARGYLIFKEVSKFDFEITSNLILMAFPR